MFDENLSKNIKALAYEKSIDVERVFKALEDALATAARKYYKTREPMEAVIDRNSGNMVMFAVKEVVENEDQIEDPQAQWTLDQARKIDPDAETGGTVRLTHITNEALDAVRAPPDQALRDGSGGDLRRHGGDQGGRARVGRARQDRGHVARARRRPGRCLRRHEGLARAVDHPRAARREDRHHPLARRHRELR